MRGTVPRCDNCGLALQEKRSRHYLDVCFCTYRIHEPAAAERVHARELAAPPAKLVQRE
jgi:hypothetical protein